MTTDESPPRRSHGGARPGSGPARQRVTLTREIAEALRKRQGDAYTGEAQEILVNRIILEWLALPDSTQTK